jgi:hypothetical protein
LRPVGAGATPATGVTFETLTSSLVVVPPSYALLRDDSFMNEHGVLDRDACTRFVANLQRVQEEFTQFPGPPGTVWERRVLFRITCPGHVVADNDGGGQGKRSRIE